MNVMLLCSDHRHVSATHVAIFRVLRAKIQIYIYNVSVSLHSLKFQAVHFAEYIIADQSGL
jgi:hypothetical protein